MWLTIATLYARSQREDIKEMVYDHLTETASLRSIPPASSDQPAKRPRPTHTNETYESLCGLLEREETGSLA